MMGMEEDTNSLREAFRRQPDETNFLVKFGLGGPCVIWVAGNVAGLFWPTLGATTVMLLMTLVYGLVLAVLSARTAHSGATRRYAEAALGRRTSALPRFGGPRSLHDVQAQPPEKAAPAPPPPPPPAVRATPFHEKYFMLRLREEVQNARRDHRGMTVVALDVTMPGLQATPEIVSRVCSDIAELASNQHKTISQPFHVAESEFVFSLPYCEAGESKAFVSKVVQGLGDYWCHFGIARYPDDATDADSLVAKAREACEASRQGKQRSAAVA